ncbi:hypothetical protein [Ichthyenterobacterium magnum]|uniref:Histidine kinase N-terminal 7TM region domain-containing protein n=1 Tax=Ichthyenterobacterium magnum TaxID=1230530 RepID=A0A420DVP2_9FLAO|nr:hypothetical protein [Ichthyenterobacterium magnum]RKE98294.1 hypothetical protein BXY80_0373 [Ichthyenterobacterium magnum]
MTEVSEFYNLSHIFISFVGAILLIAIWYNIRKRFKQLLEEDDTQKRVDKGLLYLSFSMFIWVLSGIWSYTGSVFNFENTNSFQFGVHILSIVNNMFLLLALFYFYYAPRFIYHNKKNIKTIIIIIVVTSIITFILSNSSSTNGITNNIKTSGIPDLILSGFLCYLLGISLYRTFAHRGLKIVGVISVLVVFLMFSSQLSEVFTTFGNEFSNNLIKIIAKTSLISVFLVLATTWVIRLANMPKPNEMTISFMDWSLVKISIPTKGVFDQTIDFGSKTTQYKNLLKFAIRRKYGEGNSQSISVSLGGEIKNQTYLTRIIENINSILKLDATQSLERRDLFTFIGEGRYRLRMIPNHITIDSTLLEEFCKASQNADYKTLCRL